MREAVICEPLRTPVGRYGGALKDMPGRRPCRDRPEGAGPAQRDRRVRRRRRDLRPVLPQRRGARDRPRCRPRRGPACDGRRACSSTGAAARACRLCIDAAMRVQTGVCDLVIAGGAESMSQAEYYAIGRAVGPARSVRLPLSDRIARGRVTAGGRHYPVPGGMLETAENLRREYAITREAAGRVSLASHQRAVAAQQQVASPTRSCRSRLRPARASDRLRRATSTRAPTLRSRFWPRSSRSGFPWTRSRPSPRATPAARTTPPPPAS